MDTQIQTIVRAWKDPSHREHLPADVRDALPEAPTDVGQLSDAELEQAAGAITPGVAAGVFALGGGAVQLADRASMTRVDPVESMSDAREHGHDVNADMVVRAWKDDAYRRTLPDEIQEALPAPPATEHGDLDDGQLEQAAGAVTPALGAAGAVVGGAWSVVDGIDNVHEDA